MAWEITKDRLNADPEYAEFNREGHLEGHSRIPIIAAVAGFESEELPTRGEDDQELPRIAFRLKDDDGEVYYEGWLHDDDECLNQLAALRYGEGDAGCTTIEVKRDDEWKIEIG